MTEEDEAGKKHNTTHSEMSISGNVCADLEHGRQHTATEQQQKTNRRSSKRAQLSSAQNDESCTVCVLLIITNTMIR